MKRQKTVWDKVSGFYDVFMGRDIKAYREIISRVQTHMKSDLSVLEIATGTGTVALQIADKATYIQAVDISEKMVEKARCKAKKAGIENVTFSVCDAETLELPNQSMDLVIIVNTLHIMPRSQAALQEIKRVLKNDGVLIAPTYIHAGIRKAKVFSRVAGLLGFRAYHQWTADSYREYIEGSGFRILDYASIQASIPIAYIAAMKANIHLT